MCYGPHTDESLPSLSRHSARKHATILVIGDGWIGKSSLVQWFQDNSYYFQNANNASFLSESYPGDLNLEPQTQPHILSEGFIPQFSFVNPPDLHARHQAYRNAKKNLGPSVMLLCFDITDIDTFNNVPLWLEEARRHCPQIPVVLAGTKCDLLYDEEVIEKSRSWRSALVQKEQGDALANHIGAVCYHQCSTKTGEGVREVLDSLLSAMNQWAPQAEDGVIQIFEPLLYATNIISSRISIFSRFK
ncbi:P-loop containing nucleoside triphosphate hydrolase protein [Flagelloscypha sp. PMI_526]|nr:P-loop containing nucleoside triphosphate hydrolase protein [Flagelloscypha sp. PMI_526]